MIPEFLEWYAEKAQDNAIIALLGLPIVFVLALILATALKLQGDERWKEVL